MAHAPSLTRSDRAVGIVSRHECELQDNGAWRVRDTQTGSGRWHTVFAGHCTCPDYLVRGATCKHQRAVAAEEQALRQFAANWDSRSAEARVAIDELPGDFLDSLSDEYRGPYGSDGWPQPRPTCPDCGAELESRTYYVGGRGYSCFLVCTRDIMHRSLRA